MKIGELARRSDVPVETIRYYEREKLLPLPGRTESNYRVYGPAHADRLRFIVNCRALDVPSRQIGRFVRNPHLVGAGPVCVAPAVAKLYEGDRKVPGPDARTPRSRPPGRRRSDHSPAQTSGPSLAHANGRTRWSRTTRAMSVPSRSSANVKVVMGVMPGRH